MDVEEPRVFEDSELRLRKINHFLESTGNEKPSLPSEFSVFELLREYLNDDDFTIYLENEMVFKVQHYEAQLQHKYEQWQAMDEDNQDIDQFIIFWVQTEQQLKVTFSLYDDLQREKEEDQATITVKLPAYSKITRGQSQISKISTLNSESNIHGLPQGE